jgi:hypothetical protein
MVSSLLHVLIVTPVLFLWIQERRLRLQHAAPAPDVAPAVPRRRFVAIAATVAALVAIVSLAVWKSLTGAGDRAQPDSAGIVQSIRAGDLDVVLLSPTGTLRQGRNTFTIEFRPTGTETLADVGTVHASANMAMPGMVMSGGLQVTPTATPGRYAATAEFGMAGAWQMSIEWDGPAGRGSVSVQGGVQ